MQDKRRDKPLAVALLLFLFSVYLLSYSGFLHSSDGQAMFSVAESLVRRGSYDINQIRWMGLQQGTFGLDGNLYSRKGVGTSLAALPLVWLGLVVPCWGVVQTAMLLNPLVTALTGMLVFLYVRHLGYAQRTAVMTALVFGLGTIAWPYAKYFFSEPLTALCLLAAAYFLLFPGAEQRPSLSYLSSLVAGFCLGLAVATRFANAILIPIYLSVLIVSLLRHRTALDRSVLRSDPALVISETWREVLLFALPIVLWTAAMAFYNYARFGNPLTTGYLPEESFSAPWLLGIAGLLASPGKGLIFFCPILVAALTALPSFFRRHRLEAMLVALVSLGYVLLYGKWFMWHGGFAWGPRFLVPIIPLLCLPLAPLLERLRGVMRAGFWALFALSSAIQLLGSSVHFIHYQEALLQTGLPLFDPVTFFHPRYSQILGTLPFLRPENLDFAWLHTVPSLTVDWLSLTASLFLVAICTCMLALVLRRQTAGPLTKACIFVLLPLLVAGGTALCLARYKHDGHDDYVDLLHFLQTNSQTTDVIIQNSPPETAILQNHYKGYLPCYGLFEGEQSLSQDTVALLNRVSVAHPRVWLIPDDLPPQNSSLDLWFIERGWSPVYYSFGTERLTLYSRP